MFEGWQAVFEIPNETPREELSSESGEHQHIDDELQQPKQAHFFLGGWITFFRTDRLSFGDLLFPFLLALQPGFVFLLLLLPVPRVSTNSHINEVHEGCNARR